MLLHFFCFPPPPPPLFLALFRCLYSGDSARWGNTPVPALGTVVHFRGLCSQILPSGLMAVALNNIHFSFPSEHPPRPPVSICHDERCGRQSSYLYIVVSRSGSVRFRDAFSRTPNRTSSLVHPPLPNAEPDLNQTDYYAFFFLTCFSSFWCVVRQ